MRGKRGARGEFAFSVAHHLRYARSVCSHPVAICSSAPQRPARKHEKDWEGLSLAFVSINVPVNRDCRSDALREHVERELALEGKPVRWAIVATDDESGICKVDAVVSREKTDYPPEVDRMERIQDDSAAHTTAQVS